MGVTDPSGLTFDLHKAMNEWEKDDFYESLENELQSGGNLAILHQCLHCAFKHQLKVEKISDLIVHSAYEVGDEIWATVRMEMLFETADGGPPQEFRQKAILNMSLSREKGTGTVTTCNPSTEED
jgi:hypothetical protein